MVKYRKREIEREIVSSLITAWYWFFIVCAVVSDTHLKVYVANNAKWNDILNKD